MVEQVEDFETERQFHAFRGDGEALHEGRVYVVEARQAERVAAEHAIRAIGRTNKGRLIEDLEVVPSGIGIANHVAELAAIVADVVAKQVSVAGDIHRLARLIPVHAAEFPSVEDLLREGVRE